MKTGTAHIAQEILDHLKVHQKEMKSFLMELVRMETPSKQPETQSPILNFIGERLKELGFYVVIMPGKKSGGYLFARPLVRNKDKPLQLMIGHCDTVWELGTIEKMPIKSEGNTMYGPGVYDMKAGLAQMIFALKTIRELHLTPTHTPVVLINSDEEIGSWESRSAIKRLAKISERAYILEPPLGMHGKLKTARKGLGRFTLKVTGKAAHAGLDPQKGANAIVELSYQVQNLYAMNDFDRGITVNVGMIQGGVSANVVAPESTAVVDVRVLNRADGERITKEILALEPMLPDVKLTVEGGMGRLPMERTEGNQILWKLAKAKGALLGLELEEATAGGGSDGNTTSVYTATLDGLGTTGDGAHADHEHILLKDFPVRTALLTLLLLVDEEYN
jgi:glutamate carboxypeptidase